MLNYILAEMQNSITYYIVYAEVMALWLIVISYKYKEREDERDSRRTKKVA